MQPIALAEEETLLTFNETKDYLRISRSTLFRLIDRGELTGRKVGETWRFKLGDLRQYVRDAKVSFSSSKS